MRELLADVAPAEVAASLEGLDDETAWALRAELYPRVPEAVLASLALLDVAARLGAARALGRRAGRRSNAPSANYGGPRAAARSVTGLDGDRAWELRKAARDAAPVAAIASLRGLTSDKAWRWRDRAARPRAQGGARRPSPAWTTRAPGRCGSATAPRCREALDSMIGLDHDDRLGDPRGLPRDLARRAWSRAWACWSTARAARELLDRALAAFPTNISLLKQAAIIATGANLTPAVMAA